MSELGRAKSQNTRHSNTEKFAIKLTLTTVFSASITITLQYYMYVVVGKNPYKPFPVS